MMVFAIYDSVSDTLNPTLYTFQNEGVAKRAFKAALEKGVAQLLGPVLDAPEDFYLIKLAELDQTAGGKLEACEAVRVFRFIDLKEISNG